MYCLEREDEPVASRRVALRETGDEVEAEVLEHYAYVGSATHREEVRSPDGTVVPRVHVVHVWLEREDFVACASMLPN